MNKDTWQLEDIYQNHDEWEKELQQVETLVGKMEAYQGCLRNLQTRFLLLWI